MSTSNAGATVADPVAFTVTSVTGAKHLDYEGVDGHRGVAELSASLAASLALPTNVPYSVRDEARGRMLDDGAPVGTQIPAEGAALTLVPRSHMGAGAMPSR
jgi:hypothetical protein